MLRFVTNHAQPTTADASPSTPQRRAPRSADKTPFGTQEDLDEILSIMHALAALQARLMALVMDPL